MSMKYLIQDQFSLDDFKLDIDKNGFAHSQAKLMKVGQLKYEYPNGKVVFADISLDDLEKVKDELGPISITNRHPSKMLSPDDIKKHHVGMTKGRPEIKEIDGEQWLVDGVILQDKEIINEAKVGNIGGSAGYWRKELNITDGRVQFKNIVPNHYALACISPRAKGAGLYSLDSSESEHGRIFDLDTTAKPKKEVSMAKRILNAVKGQGYSLDEARIEYTDDAQNEGSVDTLVSRERSLIDQFEKEVNGLKTSFDDEKQSLEAKNGELSGENKALKTQVAELEEKLKESISMDEAEAKLEILADLKKDASDRGIEEFPTSGSLAERILGVQRLIVEKENQSVSFDDSEIPGAYKILKKIEPKDSKEIKKAAEAKKKLDQSGGSMDSADKVSFSEIPLTVLKAAKSQLKAKRA